MPTLTSNYSLYKPLVNNATDQDLWGGYLNSDMDSIDTLLRVGITIAPQSSQTTGFTADASISVKKLYPCNATGGAFAATIPAAATAGSGAVVYIKKTDSSANAVTLTRSSSDTLDGTNTIALTAQNAAYGLVSDGVSKWYGVPVTPNIFTGDSGSGGTSGLVPAPASGDTAAGKFLKASGAWAAPIFSKSFESSQQTITSAGSLTLAHSLGARPTVVVAELVCTSSENGYTTNDRVEIGIVATVPGGTTGTASSWFASVADATNINIRFGSATNVFQLPNFSTGNIAGLTNANWKLVVRAYV